MRKLKRVIKSQIEHLYRPNNSCCVSIRDFDVGIPFELMCQHDQFSLFNLIKISCKTNLNLFLF